MSRLYGRVNDVYSIAKYFQENYKGKYKKDQTIIDGGELETVPRVISKFLSRENLEYLDQQEIEIACSPFIKETIYSGVGEEKNAIFFPSRKVREYYKGELIYFIGDLLRRKSMDGYPEKFDIRCQYSYVLPLLMEYLYLREIGKEDSFGEKYLYDISLDSPHYIRMYDKYKRTGKDEAEFLRKTLAFIVELSSVEATLQITDDIAKDNDKLLQLIDELIRNENHNREEILEKNNIETYGYKRLRKEIKDRK